MKQEHDEEVVTIRGSNQGKKMNKNMMSNSSCERFELGKEDEQKHHGELRNINNGGIRTIGGP